MNENFELLDSQVVLMDKSRDKLEESMKHCLLIDLNKELSDADEVSLEAFSARFSRLSDYLMQRIFRTLDVIEFEDEGTLRDRMNRAEKKGLIESTQDFVKIRTLRNIIAHEYTDEEVIHIYQKVLELTPNLLDTCKRIKQYIQKKGYKS